MSKYELIDEELQKVRRKVTTLLNEKNYPEAAKLMVAVAVSKIDPDEFAKQLIQKIQEYKSSKGSVSKVKRKPSKSMEKLLAEGYRKDLRLAKEFAKECKGSGSDKSK